MPNENPYRSPAVPEPSPATPVTDRIALNGTVGEDDVMAILPVPWIIRLLQVLVVTVCLPMFLLMFTVYVFRSNGAPDILPIAGLQVLLVIIGWFAFFWLGRRRRSRRLLQANAGMLGPLRGYLDEFGLNFYPPSSSELHQFSWTAIQSTIVGKHGVALITGRPTDAFIAIPDTCIEHYGVESIKPLVRRWHRECTAPPIYMTIQNWSQQPEGSVGFRKASLAYPSVAAAPYSSLKWAAFGGGLALTIMVARATIGLDYAIPLVIVGSILASRSFAPMTQEPSGLLIGYWGWLTEEGECSHSPYGNGDFRWSDATAIEVDDHHFTVTFAPENIFQLEAKDLDDGAFETVRGWLSKS